MLRKFLAKPTFVIVVWLLSTPFFAACAKPQTAVSVHVHGINYSGESFAYYIEDSENSADGTFGDLLPFSSGGSACCFSLPRKWRPGIKAQIHSWHRFPSSPDGSRPGTDKFYTIEVPRYSNGKPGDLWVIRAIDGTLSVISSDLAPDDPQWPGKIRGWPVRPLEYRRKDWELMKVWAEDGVNTASYWLAQLDEHPGEATKMGWEDARRNRPLTLNEFSGPDDPQYLVHLKKGYEDKLIYSKNELKKLSEQRP
jgi:hypothetical protein